MAIVLCVISYFIGLGQDSDTDRTGVFVQLSPGFTLPVATGGNFLGTAYDLKPGFLGEAKVFLPNKIFVGIQGSFFKADVIDIASVGDFNRTNSWHNYVLGGYTWLPRSSKFGLDTGLGLGYSIYSNRKGDVNFHEDGFSMMANLHANYRFSRILGMDLGLQFTRDFLNTDTAPPIEGFFKNAKILYFSAGVLFYIGK